MYNLVGTNGCDRSKLRIASVCIVKISTFKLPCKVKSKTSPLNVAIIPKN